MSPGHAMVRSEVGAAGECGRLAARLADAACRDEVANIVVADLRVAVGADSAILALPTDDGRHLVLASSGLSAELARDLSTFPLDSDLPIARAFVSGRPVYSQDPIEVAAQLPGDVARFGVAAFATIPAAAGGRVVAAFGLGFSRPRAFIAPERIALEALGSAVGSALERTRLHESERAANARLVLLADASTRFLQASLDLPALLEEVAGLLSESTGDAAVVRLLAADGRRWTDVAFREPDDAAQVALGAAMAADPGRAEEGLKARVTASAATLFSPVVDAAALRARVPLAFHPFLDAHPVHSLVVVPLRGEGGVVGTVSLMRHRPHLPYGIQDRLLVEGVADRAAVAVAFARLHAAHTAARDAAERAAARTARLQRVTSAFAAAVTVADVAVVAVQLAIDAAGGAAGALGVLEGDPPSLRVVGERGLSRELEERDRVTPLAAVLPLSRCLESGGPIFHDDGAAGCAAFPELCEYLIAGGHRALAALPLRTPRAVLGAFGIRYTGPRRFDAEERAFLENLAEQCAQALERAQLWERERDAARRQAILADGSRALSEAGGELPAVLEALVSRVAAGLDAACVLHLVSGDRRRLEPAAFRHLDPAGHALLREALASPAGVDEGVAAVILRTGRGLLVTRLEPAIGPAATPARRAYLERFLPASLVAAPLAIDGRVEGTVVATGGAQRPPFTADDQRLLEEIAARAGLAIAQARRHAEVAAERARLAEVLDRAEVASRAKDEFLAMLSHELRNPLAPIVTALHLMKLRGGDASSREREVIERQVAHLLRLVDDLLDVSRVTRGKVRLDRRAVEVADLVARGVELASPLLEEGRHTLRVEVASGLRVDADPGRMAQVISNLLTNAAKYTDRGGRIAVRASAEGAFVRIAVTDSGIGISPSLLPRIFDLFVQGERTLDRAPGGLGIGLTIARSLVDLHGGRIAAESPGAGRGSSFTVWIPVAVRSADAAPASRIAEPAPRPPALRILVVDDNEDAAELLADALRARGHVAEVAFDGPSALSLVEAFRPRVALLDLGLPVMDGYELARRLRAGPAGEGLTLVAVTGYGQDLDRRLSAQAGFHEHLVKPVELERVCEVVERLAPR